MFKKQNTKTLQSVSLETMGKTVKEYAALTVSIPVNVTGLQVTVVEDVKQDGQEENVKVNFSL